MVATWAEDVVITGTGGFSTVSLAVSQLNAAAGQRLRLAYCSTRILWPGQTTH